jgi:ribonuclease P protein component
MRNFDYPRQARLLDAGDFRSVFDKAEIKASTKYFLLLARRNSLSTPRIGFVLSKKNIKLAVDRNRIKRVSRDYFRLERHKIPSIDIVFLGRKGIAEIDNETFRQQLHYSIKKLISKADQISTDTPGQL